MKKPKPLTTNIPCTPHYTFSGKLTLYFTKMPHKDLLRFSDWLESVLIWRNWYEKTKKAQERNRKGVKKSSVQAKGKASKKGGR